MSVSSFKDLWYHVGHTMECVTYGKDEDNVAIECLDCGKVLLDYNNDHGLLDELYLLVNAEQERSLTEKEAHRYNEIVAICNQRDIEIPFGIEM